MQSRALESTQFWISIHQTLHRNIYDEVSYFVNNDSTLVDTMAFKDFKDAYTAIEYVVDQYLRSNDRYYCTWVNGTSMAYHNLLITSYKRILQMI
jgi:hypothetical protein